MRIQVEKREFTRRLDEWQLKRVPAEFLSGIGVYTRAIVKSDCNSAGGVRREWLSAGYVVTGYDDGSVRVSTRIQESDRKTVSQGMHRRMPATG